MGPGIRTPEKDITVTLSSVVNMKVIITLLSARAKTKTCPVSMPFLACGNTYLDLY
ncbi:hypothetical protein IBK_0308 [Dehalococcoides mccartyi IBARAKI]|nr:hypothetical protein IBK_0308 [Dehalococcoides mccartyi IBARAKI]BEL00376.1 hypothetical protein DMOBY_02290 [Dehalococcoides mccartyi]